jgi:hypothetical protein
MFNAKGKSMVVAQQRFFPGQAFALSAPSHRTSFAAVFEDDGETGYFYGLDNSRRDQPILDALHVYNVKDISDRSVESLAQIMWSVDGLKVALLINKYPHAVFDFAKRRGYCRTAFPPPAPGFSSEGHQWSEKVLKHFK